MKKQFYFTMCIFGCISFLTWVGFRSYNKIQFDRHCSGYLKRAADANTIELAKKQLTVVVKYCEAHELTSGFTSIIYTTPDEDVEFWYNNLKSSLTELDSVSANATQLEKSNVLMKLRETLLDNDDKGKTKITYPAGVYIYPYNIGYLLWAIISLLITGLFGFGAYKVWYD